MSEQIRNKMNHHMCYAVSQLCQSWYIEVRTKNVLRNLSHLLQLNLSVQALCRVGILSCNVEVCLLQDVSSSSQTMRFWQANARSHVRSSQNSKPVSCVCLGVHQASDSPIHPSLVKHDVENTRNAEVLSNCIADVIS